MFKFQLLCFVIVCASVNGAFKKESIASEGLDSNQAAFPYFAFLEIDSYVGNITCGGSLISDQWILTAARCLIYTKEMKVYTEPDKMSYSYSEGHTPLVCGRQNFFPHRGYGVHTKANDIGLVKLPQPIEFSKTVQPIRLPTTCERNENADVNSLGYRWTYEDSIKKFMPSLQRISMRTSSRSQCYRAYPFFKWRRTVVCAKSKHKLTVATESGIPLVRQNDTTLIAVSSFFNLNGGFEDLPKVYTVYTYVAPYHYWIMKTTGLNLTKCQ